MAERLSAFVGGIPIFLIGVIVVFSMLILLILFMSVLGMVMTKATTKKDQKKALEAAEANKAESEAAPTVEANVTDDLELVAVITAAIAASLGTSSDKLQVRSLRKVQRKPL